MNIAKLKELRDFLTRNEDAFNYNVWLLDYNNMPIFLREIITGTNKPICKFCVAGGSLTTSTYEEIFSASSPRFPGIYETATKLLGLSQAQANWLFIPSVYQLKTKDGKEYARQFPEYSSHDLKEALNKLNDLIDYAEDQILWENL